MPPSHESQQQFARRASQYTVANIEKQNKRHRRTEIWSVSIILILLATCAIGLGVGLTRPNAEAVASGDSPSAATPTPTTTQQESSIFITPTAAAYSTPTGSTNISYNAGAATSGTFWRPTAGTTWQIELITALTTTSSHYQVYDIDLFDNPASTIQTLHAAGKNVICYFSAGSYENFRPDSSSFVSSDYGKGLDGWPGEYWLNTSSPNVRKIMVNRLNLAVQKGCDGVDPDNVDGFDGHDTGFELTADTAVDYLRFLAAQAHSRGLAIGLKNAGAIVNQTVAMMQWEINEQCEQYDECSTFQPFIAANKPVFHIEYPDSAPNPTTEDKSTLCHNSDAKGFSTVLKNMNLDAWVYSCP